jgi:hypothetical protein
MIEEVAEGITDDGSSLEEAVLELRSVKTV